MPKQGTPSLCNSTIWIPWGLGGGRGISIPIPGMSRPQRWVTVAQDWGIIEWKTIGHLEGGEVQKIKPLL